MCVTFSPFLHLLLLSSCLCVNARVASAKSRTVGWANDRLTSTLSTPHHLRFFTQTHTHTWLCELDDRKKQLLLNIIFSASYPRPFFFKDSTRVAMKEIDER